MNAESLLAKAPQYFKNTTRIIHYKPKRIKDIYGYQYLIKGDPAKIEGAIHTERFLEENTFGRFDGESIILSTKTQMKMGDLIEANGVLYAISHQKPINERLNECDYVCFSVFDYYKEFIVDTQDQAQRILGVNSNRYVLAYDFGVPIFPSFFQPTEEKYLSFSVFLTETRSAPYKNEDLFIEQIKQDHCELRAVGLDTNELQKIALDLYSLSSSDFSLAIFPSWEEWNRYDKAFDLKGNIQKMNLVINYKITTTEVQEADKILKKVFWNFNFI